ncbi:hypothetical protein K1T71_010840 [Dendrolimus kikuchii]|uniref:Uncharacterized protein n=1 Tax=Dendrolimus kikuchii TaxID=765133 RepID=A0ACC1CQD9_9NEOP|nr:hypothetical protein K1T71_010840 [Dendrolimus kikuchii]
MSNKNKTSQTVSENSKLLESMADAGTSGYFIDDYSHLRLSYYQLRGNDTEDSLSSQKSNGTLSSDASMDGSCKTFDTVLSETSINPAKVDVDRQKMRDYNISQIPDFPHPAFSVASIISSASQRMESDICLIYNDKIEQGNTRNLESDVEEFTPNRRSTLKPSDFVFH